MRVPSFAVAAGVAAFLALLPAAAAPPTQGAALAPRQVGHAYLRVLHAVPDAPPVAVYLDGELIVHSLAFGHETADIVLPAVTHTIQIAAVGTPYTSHGGLIVDTATLAAGAYYTLAAVGRLQETEPLLLTDLVPYSTEQEAQVRFVHLAPDAPVVDLVAERVIRTKRQFRPKITFEQVGFTWLDTEPYIGVPGGAYILSVHPTGRAAVLARQYSVSFTPGHSYTVSALGLLTGRGVQQLHLAVSDDTPLRAGL